MLPVAFPKNALDQASSFLSFDDIVTLLNASPQTSPLVLAVDSAATDGDAAVAASDADVDVAAPTGDGDVPLKADAKRSGNARSGKFQHNTIIKLHANGTKL